MHSTFEPLPPSSVLTHPSKKGQHCALSIRAALRSGIIHSFFSPPSVRDSCPAQHRSTQRTHDNTHTVEHVRLRDRRSR
ncbi:hypothetical protein SRHO_G00195540 [Serrasalmus rhombeus]